MDCVNKYEALTPEAMDVLNYWARQFRKYAAIQSMAHNLPIREIAYLAVNGITAAEAELVLTRAMKQRKAEQSRKVYICLSCGYTGPCMTCPNCVTPTEAK